MNIVIIGAGYVGLVSAACLAELGHRITCMDIDKPKIEMLKKGHIPICEIGLKELLAKNTNKIHFTNQIKRAVKTADVIFITVGTPQKEDGSANLKFFFDAIQKIADSIQHYTVIVNKSTVPIGTSDHVKSLVLKRLNRRNADVPFDIVSNPEFLREGTSIQDFMQPDRIVIGSSSEKARKYMIEIYKSLSDQGYSLIFCDNSTAETIKYAANAFLAVKISFINELALLCDSIGADVNNVAYGIGTDKRIGKAFLQAGPGFGGSCFPKDTRALLYTANTHNSSLSIVQSAVQSNDLHKKYMCKKIFNALNGDIANKTIAVLGLAYKKNTDDMRYSPSLVIINYLIESKTNIKVYDPAAMENAQNNYFQNKNIYYAHDKLDALSNADALVILTEWDDFKTIDLKHARTSMAGKTFIDLRNLYERKAVEEFGFDYYCVGR